MFTQKKAKLGERAQANASKLSQLEALSCSQLPRDVFETGDGAYWCVFWYSALSKCIYQSIGTARKCPSSIIQSGIHRQIQQNVKHVSYPACKESIDWTELSHFFCILENCRSNFKLGLYTSFRFLSTSFRSQLCIIFKYSENKLSFIVRALGNNPEVLELTYIICEKYDF